MAISAKLQAGRDAVDKYRADHSALYAGRIIATVAPDHGPIYETLMVALNSQGYLAIEDFFLASGNYNAQSLDYKDLADLEAKATKASKQNLLGMWH